MKTDIIGYDCNWGCQDEGCADGPDAAEKDIILKTLAHLGVDATWRGTVGAKTLGDRKDFPTKEKTLPFLLESLKRLLKGVQQAAGNKSIPIILGGDHSSAMATWAGVASALKMEGKFGLIWLDAHLDSHTFETSHEGKWGGWWHGQPVTALMGYGLEELHTLGSTKPKISPQHLSIIGPHSFEPAEVAFVKKHNIRVYYIEEVRERGFKAVFAEALARATTGTEGFGLTIDLDGFDPTDAPGVSSREEGGMKPAEVLPLLKSLARHPMFRALEIAELNPRHDQGGKTAKLVSKIIETVFERQ